MRRALVIAGVMLAGLLALAPALATAAPKPMPATGFAVEQVNLQRHFGDFVVYLQYEEEDERAAIIVSKGPYFNTYLTSDAELDGKTLTARFGRLGSLRMTLDGPVRHAKMCGHRSETYRSFKGEFEFHGEEGFLDFDVHSMPGEVEALSTCPGVRPRPAEPETREATATLGAASTGPLPRDSWVAFASRHPHHRLVGALIASRQEREEGLRIARQTIVRLGASGFEWDLEKGTATVRSKAPFTGRATFHRHPRGGAAQITGNLRVRTLAGPTLALTGKRFKAMLTKELPQDEKRVLGPGTGPLAAASRLPSEPEPEVDNVVFGLRSEGFTVDVSAVENGDAQIVSLEIGRGPLRATYLAPATITGDSVTAKFGSLGELNFHYAPKTGTRKCSGKLTFTGSFTFTGENGYVHIDADHADGIFEEKLYAPECGGDDPKEPAVRVLGRYDGVRLEAKAGSAADGAIRNVEVEEWRTKGGRRKANVRALLVEKLEGMTVGRGVYTTVGALAFRRDPKAGTATLRPPGPFTGSAKLIKGAWEGSLKIPILGGQPVEMAGSEFRASIQKSVPRDE